MITMTTKRNLPKTSINAFLSRDAEHLGKTYQSILDALKELKSASAEQIALYLGKEHEQINRRVSELEKQNKIYRNGKQVLTTKGRLANCWALVEINQMIENKPIVLQSKLF